MTRRAGKSRRRGGELFMIVDGKAVDAPLHAEFLAGKEEPDAVEIAQDRAIARRAGLGEADIDELFPWPARPAQD